jgi:dipeptide/tripeptide permease
MVVQVTDDRIRDMGFAWFYTATFMAGAIWSPAVGYIAESVGLTAVFGAMAASFVLASLCIVLGQLQNIPRAQLATTDSLSHSLNFLRSDVTELEYVLLLGVACGY